MSSRLCGNVETYFFNYHVVIDYARCPQPLPPPVELQQYFVCKLMRFVCKTFQYKSTDVRLIFITSLFKLTTHFLLYRLVLSTTEVMNPCNCKTNSSCHCDTCTDCSKCSCNPSTCKCNKPCCPKWMKLWQKQQQ